DVLRRHAETASHEGVAELVEDDAPEDGEDEEDARHGRLHRRPAEEVERERPGQEEAERPVKEHVDAGDAADAEGAAHAGVAWRVGHPYPRSPVRLPEPNPYAVMRMRTEPPLRSTRHRPSSTSTGRWSETLRASR